MDLTAQIFGLLATLLSVLSFQCRSTRALLLCQMSGNVAFVVHYLMLGSYSASLGQIVLILNILALTGHEKARRRRRKWRWIFAVLSLGLSIATWQDGFSILPCAAVLVTIFTNWTFDGTAIRLGKLCLSCPAWVVYDIHVGSWSGLLCEGIAMGSALTALIRFRSR